MSVPVDPEQDPREPRPAPALPRIGDAERDRAVGFLQEHMAQGRLDHQEFDDRLTRALRARTDADLQPLFDDLPEPRPSNGLATTSSSPPPWAGAAPPAAVPTVPAGASSVPATPQGTPRWVQLVMAAVWPLAVLVCFAIGWDNWWVWIAAGMVTYFLRQAYPGDPPPPPDADDPPALGR